MRPLLSAPKANKLIKVGENVLEETLEQAPMRDVTPNYNKLDAPDSADIPPTVGINPEDFVNQGNSTTNMTLPNIIAGTAIAAPLLYNSFREGDESPLIKPGDPGYTEPRRKEAAISTEEQPKEISKEEPVKKSIKQMSASEIMTIPAVQKLFGAFTNQDTEGTVANLKAQQSARDKSIQDNELAKIMVQAAYGGTKAGLTPDLSSYDAQIKRAGQGVEDLNARIAMEKKDPNSGYSKSMREMAKSLGINVPDQMSAELIGSIMPEFDKKFDRDYRAREQQLNREARLLQHKETMASKALDKTRALDEKTFRKVESLQKRATAGVAGKALEAYNTSNGLMMDIKAALDSNGKDAAKMMESIIFKLRALKALQGDNSVVRESDLAVYDRSLGVMEEWRQKFGSYFGPTKISPEAKQIIFNTMNQINKTNKDIYNRTTMPIRKQAESEGLPIDQVFQSDFVEMQKKTLPPGTIVQKGGKKYKVNEDGSTLTEVK